MEKAIEQYLNQIRLRMMQNQKSCQPSEKAEPEYRCKLCKDTEWLSRVNEDGYEISYPCGCAEEKRNERRLAFANIPAEFKGQTVDNFDISLYTNPDAKEKAEMCKKLCMNYVEKFDTAFESGKGLYLYSSVKGSGKTRMAVSIANDIILKHKIQVRFATTIQILDKIKETWESEEYTERKFLDDIIVVPVLIIDDVGVERASEWVDEKFYSILNGRMISKKITIFTSNMTIEQLKFDERIINRIIKMAVPVPFPDESVRTKIARAENNEFYKMLLA